MKIVIADGTRVGCARIRKLVSGIPGAETAGTAEDPSTLLRLLGEIRPDALIVDPEIGGTGGLSLVGDIIRDRPALIVIVLTNASGPSYRKHYRNAGVRIFLDKSTEFQKVVPALEAILRGTAPPQDGPRESTPSIEPSEGVIT